MTHITLILSLVLLPAPRVHHGVAAQHRSLERVARIRKMPDTGVLFASPLYPVGTRVCVTSRRMKQPTCGIVVDGPMPEHRAWQLRTKRIVEVQPEVAKKLCQDPSGPPSMCKISLWRVK